MRFFTSFWILILILFSTHVGWGQTTESLNCPIGTIVSNTMTFNTTNFSFVHAKGTGTSFAAYQPWRVYTNNTVTISGGSNVCRIASIIISTGSTAYANAVTGGSVQVSSGTGTLIKSASGSVITITASGDVKGIIIEPNAQSRWTNIQINFLTLEQCSVPTISSPTTSLSSFNYCFGSGPSAQQNFTVSGSNLTDNITVTPPTNYEISTTSGSGFTSSAITLTHSSGTVASTTIYTRLKAGLAAGNYNGETIAITSTDATSKSVTLNGSVTAPSTPTVSISASTNSICPGTNVTFTATPSNLGGGTASYQWKKNGSDVGTGTTYASTSLANGDVITCVMTVAGGCVSPNTASSNGITMIVNTANTVTFNKNATSATGTMANQTACQATNLTNNAYTNAGYIFAGWNTQPDGSGTSYANGDSYDFSVNITLYAQWVEGSIVCYDFGVEGASDGFGSSVVVDPYISFQSYKNSGTTNPALHAGGLRLYQNAIKGGGIVFSAADPAIITDVEIVLQNHSDGDGPANYTINGIAGGSFASELSILNINGVSADSVGLYNTGSSSSNRTYIQSFCVTYILPPTVLCDHTITTITPTSGPVGTVVTIDGTGFTNGSTVTIGGVAATVEYVSSTQLKATVNTGSITGNVVVTEDGCNLTGPGYTVLENDNCGVGGAGTPTNWTGLLISGVYDETSGNCHYIELYNPTSNPINLSGYSLKNQNNDANTSMPAGFNGGTINLSGTIPANGTFIVMTTSGSTPCASCPDAIIGQAFTNLSTFGFNGYTAADKYDKIVLAQGSTNIDLWVNGHQYSSGFIYRRSSSATAPSTTWNNAHWTGNNEPDCFDFQTVIESPEVEIAQVGGVSCSLNMEATVTAGNGGVLTYKWYYNENDGVATGWTELTSSSFPGLIITGETTNNLQIVDGTSPISILDNYQFYCLVTENSCSSHSNALQFVSGGERYYKSTQSGNWTTVSTWLMAPAVSGPWSAACTYPTATNSDYISIENGHTVTLDIDLDADQIIVQSTGTLVLNEKLTVPNGNASTEDLLVEGTLIDNGNTTNGIAFVNGGTWLLGTQGTIIKTWSSGVLPYKENYQGGISTIPATAHWYYRYVGNDLVVTTTVGMYYPNLYFESSAGFHAWDAATEVLSGSTATAVVKGNLSIGATNTGTVEVFNNNTFASPILVHGNVYVGAGSALRNTSQGGGIGTGFEIKGETIEIEGNYVMESGTIGKTILSGAALQNIVSLTGNGQFLNAHVELNNTNDARLNGIDMDISSTLTFTDGVIHTILAQADKVNITNSATTAIVNAQATSAQNRYVNGKLQWTLANGGTYTFPVGSTKGTYGAQGFTFTVDNGAGDVLAYLETNISAPIKDYAYCDLEEHTGVGIVNAGDGNPGYDGILDQIEFNIHSPLQWNITNPSGGSITQYDIVVLATGLQDINPVVTANNIPVRYLMRNGQPGNPTVPTTSTPDFAALGFDMCPNQYTLENMTGFSFFTLDGATQEGTVLPIEVISFTGEAVNNNAAVLNWITATELNNDYFTLYYSADGVQFDELVRVSGAGTSNQTNYYTHRHTLLNRGVHYYKLYSTDYDGTNYYRGIVAVEIEGTQVYFNPVTATIELLHKDDVKLYTTDGKLIAEGTNVNSIPVHHKGVFLLHFLRSGKTERLVIY